MFAIIKENTKITPLLIINYILAALPLLAFSCNGEECTAVGLNFFVYGLPMLFVSLIMSVHILFGKKNILGLIPLLLDLYLVFKFFVL